MLPASSQFGQGDSAPTPQPHKSNTTGSGNPAPLPHAQYSNTSAKQFSAWRKPSNLSLMSSTNGSVFNPGA